jgi:2-C-methyl-D-erythritol 4-phosphate cytidylyltransferase
MAGETLSRPARFAGLLVAAGRGERFGTEQPKQFANLGGRPLYEHAARVFESTPLIADWYLVVPGEYQEVILAEAAAADLTSKLRQVVSGGPTRQESVWLGLRAISSQAPRCSHVLIHDAVRPFLTHRLVQRTAAAAVRQGAATAALPVTDTLVRGVPEETTGQALDAVVDRAGIWSVQTPQAFALDLLVRAHEEALRSGREATDDSGLVRELGAPVALVPGNWWNIKVTVAEDLHRAESLLFICMRLLESETIGKGRRLEP